MVLPTDFHGPLREWLRSHRIATSELGGTLVIQNLDGLLRLSGTSRRLTAEERRLITAARAYRRARSQDPLTYPGAASDQRLSDGVHAVLIDVCDALGAAGVSARPGLGLGIVLGDEIFGGMIYVSQTDRLYELMKADGFDADPPWEAPNFQSRFMALIRQRPDDA